MPGYERGKSSEWGVRDKNARSVSADGTTQPRVHEPVLGVTYPLVFDRPYYMPERHARVFLKDPAFVVTDEDDRDVAPLNDDALSRTAPATLAPNVVIADVNELTDEALLTRAMQMSGGQRFTPETAREVLVRFLIDGNTASARAASTTASDHDDADGGSPLELDEMDPADSSRMLEGA